MILFREHTVPTLSLFITVRIVFSVREAKIFMIGIRRSAPHVTFKLNSMIVLPIHV